MQVSDKPILSLDFDGVLHSYESGWVEADFIPDPPVPGAMRFVFEAVKVFQVHVFSSRSSRPDGIRAMQNWLKYWMIRELVDAPTDSSLPWSDVAEAYNSVKWPNEKPPAVVALDDRVITFTGKWPSLDELRALKPWNKS